MLNINNEIEQLHQLMENIPPRCEGMGMLNRLFAWGILTMFNKINRDLETLSMQLDTTINQEAISIDFDKYCDQDYWTGYRLFEPTTKRWGLDYFGENNQTSINWMTDYLPNGKEGYNITPEVLDSFKTAMHQLCDEDKIKSFALEFALDKGFITMQQLLDEIQEKVKSPEPHLYEKLWNEIQEEYVNDRCTSAYRDWFQDVGKPTFEELKAKQIQEIFEFLETGFFRYAKPPTGKEVKNRKLVISEDDLEVGSEIPEDFDVFCTQFERFIEWKEDSILVFNYEKLGQYIYRNYKNLTGEELYCIVAFDKIMDSIHEAMARLKPGLAQYLKRYQDNLDGELLNNCKAIFAPFKEFLKTDIRQTLLDEYLEKLLFDSDLKEEAKKKLGGQSKNKYCCAIVIALSDCYIFQGQYKAEDFSKVLYTELNTINQTSFLRYLKTPETKNAALSKWTRAVIDNLKEHPYERQKEG